MKICTFCGHSQITEQEKIEAWLTLVIENLINDGFDVFYLGGYGDFDNICCSVLTKHKEKYPYIKRVFVTPYIDKNFDKNSYDESYYPSLENTPKRFAISKRNEKMVEQADVVVAYVIYSWGGASKTLEFAKRKKKNIINFKNDEEFFLWVTEKFTEKSQKNTVFQ